MKKSRVHKFQRKRALWRGQMAENFVAGYLRLRGYRILARQFRKPVGEIDIVALKKSCLIAIEVKYRQGEMELERLVTSKQKRRIRRCLEAFRSENPKYRDCDMRCDLVAMANFHSLPAHFENAW